MMNLHDSNFLRKVDRLTEKFGYFNAARFSFFLLVCMMISPELFAHAEKGVAAGFGTGFMHPISGWDHILAMIAVGLWGAELGAPAIWILPVTFPMMMAFGGFIGLLGIPLPGV